MMYMPARPIQTFRPVTSIRWSWYHWNAPRSLPPASVPVYVYVTEPPFGAARKSSGWPSFSAVEWFPWLWSVSSPAAAGRLLTRVTVVVCPVGRRMVGPGNVPL